MNSPMAKFLDALHKEQEDTKQAANSIADRIGILEHWIAEDKQWFSPQQLKSVNGSMTPEQDALLRAADKWHDDLSLGTHWVGCHTEHSRCMIYKLARELRAALVDAERYRYLRSWQGQWLVVREEPEDTQLHGDVLDAAIDAARAESKV